MPFPSLVQADLQMWIFAGNDGHRLIGAKVLSMYAVAGRLIGRQKEGLENRP